MRLHVRFLFGALGANWGVGVRRCAGGATRRPLMLARPLARARNARPPDPADAYP